MRFDAYSIGGIVGLGIVLSLDVPGGFGRRKPLWNAQGRLNIAGWAWVALVFCLAIFAFARGRFDVGAAFAVGAAIVVFKDRRYR